MVLFLEIICQLQGCARSSSPNWIKYPLSQGSFCSTTVEHMPAEQVIKFDSGQVLFFSFSIPQWCTLSPVPGGGAALLIIINKNGCLVVLLG